MDLPSRGVVVIELPPSINPKPAQDFVRELASSIASVIRPCIVFDCARLRRIDSAFLHLLVCSLEEAMKRNGDVRLSGLPEAALPALKSMGVERLFRFYSTASQAVESFHRPGALATVFVPSQEDAIQPSAHAA